MSSIIEDDAFIQDDIINRVIDLENQRSDTIPSVLNQSDRTTGISKIAGSGSAVTNIDPLILNFVDHGTVGLVTEQIDISVSGGNFHILTVNDDFSLAFDNPPGAAKVQRFIIEIKQDGVGGHNILSWPTALINPPTLETSANGFTRVEFYTYDEGLTYHALSVTTGVGGSTLWSAVVIDVTKDMVGEGLTNLGTILPAANKDIGSEVDPWRIIHSTKYEFHGTPNSSPTNISDTLIQLGSNGMDFNVDLPTEDYRFYIDGTLRARLYMSGLDSRFDVDQINSDLFLLDDTGVDPGLDGIFSLNNGDVKVRSGGVVRNLSDISAGSGPGFQDDQFNIFGNENNSRILMFQVDGISNSTTRTVTAQDANGVMALLDGGLVQDTSNEWLFRRDVTIQRNTTHALLHLYGDVASPGLNDEVGQIFFEGNTTGAGASRVEFGNIHVTGSDFNHATRSGDMEFTVLDGSTQTLQSWLIIDGDTQNLRFNTPVLSDSITPNNPGDFLGNDADPWSKATVNRVVFTQIASLQQSNNEIGANNTALWLNQTNPGSSIQLAWDGTVEYNFTETTATFGTPTSPKALIFQATNNASITKLGSDPFRFQSTDGMTIESGPGSNVGQILRIRGDLGVNNLVGSQIIFEDDNSLSATHEYGLIKSRVGNNTAGIEDGIMEFEVYESGSAVKKLELNGLNSEIRVFDRMVMDGNSVFELGEYIEFSDSRGNPGQSGLVRRMFLDSANSDHLSVVTPTGLIDLEALASGVGANTELSNLGVTAINANLNLNSLVNIIPSFDLGSNLGDNAHSFSQGYIRSLFLDDPSMSISNTANTLQIKGLVGQDVLIQEGATSRLRWDSSLGQWTFFNEVEFNNEIRVDGGNVIKAHDSTEMGFQVTNENINLGIRGTIQIPRDNSNIGSAAQADIDFGDKIGCIGLYLNGGLPGTPSLVIKIDDSPSTWQVLVLQAAGDIIAARLT